MAQTQSLAISIVIPVFNEKESLRELVERIHHTLSGTIFNKKFEILFVDDGSSDGSREEALSIGQDYPFIRIASLRTNFGKSMALMTGFVHARGEFIVTMDADLQDNPEDIPLLLNALQQGNLDLVSGWRKQRHDTKSRRLGSFIYNKVIHIFSGMELKDQNCGFKIYRKSLADRLNIYGHFHRFLPMQAHLMGYRIGQVVVKNNERKYGTSKYRTLRYEGLFDFLSVLFLVKFGYSPLHFFGIIALFFIIPSAVILAYFIGMHILSLFDLGGVYLVARPLLNISLTTMLTGIIILVTGFVCDFFLYHHSRANRDSMVNFALRDIYGPGSITDEAASNE